MDVHLSGYESGTHDGSAEQLRAEVVRLQELARSLEDLAERRTADLNKALTRNEALTRKLQDSQAKLAGLAEQSLVGIAIVDGTRFISVNPCWAETFGYQPDELLALPVIQTVAHSSRLRVVQHLRDCLANEPHQGLLEFEGLKKDGSPVYVEFSSSRVDVGGALCLLCVATDVTARFLAERKAQALNRWAAELAVRDPLTGLYNKRFMEASLERELIQAKRNNSPLSVVKCDVDHFKAVNEALGREAGDEVLKALASLLMRQCRRSDIVCRYAGEEFLLVFPSMPAAIAASWAEKMRAAIAGSEITKGSTGLHVTASFGIATYPEHGRTWQEIVAAADEAQGDAKFGGKNQVRCASPGEARKALDMPTQSKAELNHPELARLAAKQA